MVCNISLAKHFERAVLASGFAFTLANACCEQALGDAGLEQRVDRNIALAEHFERAVLASGGAFQMVLPRSFANVCFWWLPASLRPFDAAAASPQQKATLGKVWQALFTRFAVVAKRHEN